MPGVDRTPSGPPTPDTTLPGATAPRSRLRRSASPVDRSPRPRSWLLAEALQLDRCRGRRFGPGWFGSAEPAATAHDDDHHARSRVIEKEYGALEGRGRRLLPQIRFVQDNAVARRTAGRRPRRDRRRSESLAPPGIPVGRVAQPRRSARVRRPAARRRTERRSRPPQLRPGRAVQAAVRSRRIVDRTCWRRSSKVRSSGSSPSGWCCWRCSARCFVDFKVARRHHPADDGHCGGRRSRRRQRARGDRRVRARHHVRPRRGHTAGSTAIGHDHRRRRRRSAGARSPPTRSGGWVRCSSASALRPERS